MFKAMISKKWLCETSLLYHYLQIIYGHFYTTMAELSGYRERQGSIKTPNIN